MFIKLPGQVRGSRVDAPVQTIDVVPTIVAALGGKPRPWHGRSLLGPTPPARDAAVLSSYPRVVRLPMPVLRRQQRATLRRQALVTPGG